MAYGSVDDNTYSNSARQLVYDSTDITSSYPNPFQVIGGAVSAVSAIGPDNSPERWLAF